MKFIHLNRILGVVGFCLFIESLFMLIPFFVAVYFSEIVAVYLLEAFGFTCILSLLIMYYSKRSVKNELTLKDSFVVVLLAWIFISILGTLPYILTQSIPNFVDALFETISGFTTTGSSILNNIEALPKSVLFWRAETHWLGGMGILVLVVAVLPLIKKNGINLMVMEGAFLSVDKIKPKLIDVARQFWGIYIVLTGFETVLLKIFGMNWYDALCHSFATIATGGFSTKNTSLIDFSPAIQYTVTMFMFLSGMNFALHFLILNGRYRKVLKNEELRWYIGLTLVISLLISIFALGVFNNDFELSFRHSLFQVVSIITATGFASADYEIWPNVCVTLIFCSMFIGACVGSTGGGIKIARYIVVFKYIRSLFHRMVNPNIITSVKYSKKALSNTLVTSIIAFVVIYFITFIGGTLIMTATGLDIKSSSSSIITTLGGIGPGIGIIGPTENFSSISVFGKIYLSFNMILGRLEIFPILVLFTKAFYR